MAEYQPFIAQLSDELIGELWQAGELNLDDLSLRLAVQVAAQVIGLTSSAVPGMERRITRFVEMGGDGNPASTNKASAAKNLVMQGHTLNFFLLDVKPSIAARRREPQDDLISYLLERGYSDTEILTECLTYGTAGMITTREFISLAAWQLVQHPELREDYLHAPEAERFAILHEILRLDPVVTQLFRRVVNDIEVGSMTIPAGSLVALNVQQANVDREVVGEDAEALCPHRPLPRGVQPPVLSFGDGHHRCPGAFLAIRESDVFLRRLLIWRDLELVQPLACRTTRSSRATSCGPAGTFWRCSWARRHPLSRPRITRTPPRQRRHPGQGRRARHQAYERRCCQCMRHGNDSAGQPDLFGAGTDRTRRLTGGGPDGAVWRRQCRRADPGPAVSAGHYPNPERRCPIGLRPRLPGGVSQILPSLHRGGHSVTRLTGPFAVPPEHYGAADQSGQFWGTDRLPAACSCMSA
ncbi:cytochrome P450 [Deinococcus radiophilus]|uniref:cytochrome P450 n=1 Tax=Deinococcus radiophilus TaxID=32062 RepID=UPI00361F3AE5